MSALPVSDPKPRNYVAEMRHVIDQATGRGPYSAPITAVEIVKRLRVTDPDLLAGWLDAMAEQLIRQAILARDCSMRSHARATASRGEFSAAAERFESGDAGALGAFSSMHFTLADGMRKRLADLEPVDLDAVMDDYERRIAQNQMSLAFLRVIRKKVKRGKVSDFFTEQKLAAAWASLNRASQ